MATTQVKITRIQTASPTSINNGQTAMETVAGQDADLSFPMHFHKIGDTVYKHLAKDQAARVTTLEATTSLKLASGATINELSTDGTLAGDSDTAVPTEQAVKTYVDGLIATSDYWDRSTSPNYTYLQNTGDVLGLGNATTESWTDNAIDFGGNAILGGGNTLGMYQNLYNDGAEKTRTAAESSAITMVQGSMLLRAYDTATVDTTPTNPNQITINPISTTFNAASIDADFIVNYDSGRAFFVNGADGNVTVDNKLGIGVVPVYNLQVNAAADVTAGIIPGSSADNCTMIFRASNNWQILSEPFTDSMYDFGINFNRNINTGEFYIAHNGSKKFILDENGNVGINEQSPVLKLDVKGPNSNGIRYTSTGSIINVFGASSTGGFIGTTSNHDLEFYTNASQKMVITSAGNVGIGVAPNSNWTEKAIDWGSGAVWGNSSEMYFGENLYDDGDIKAYATGASSYISCQGGAIQLKAFDTATTGTTPTNPNYFQLSPTSTVINVSQDDINTLIYYDLGIGLYLDGGNGRTGNRTSTPLSNVGTTSNNFDSNWNGFHIYSSNRAALVVEGTGQVPNGVGYPGAGLYLVDRVQTTDNKILSLEAYNGNMRFGRYEDDNFATYVDILELSNTIFYVYDRDLLIYDTTKSFGFNSTNFEYANSGDMKLVTPTSKTLFLEEEVYKDIQFPTGSAKVPASNAPTWTTFSTNTNKYTWAVNDYADLQANEVIHEFKEGSDVQWHIHIFTNGSDGTDRYVKYIIYFDIVNNDGTFSERSVTSEITIPASTADRTHIIQNIGVAATGLGIDIGADVTCRLKRETASGSAPTSDPFVSMVGLHVACDTLGSRTMTTK